MTTSTSQSTFRVSETPPEPAAVTTGLARLTTSAEPAVVLTSLAALCVPLFSQECCIAVAEDDQEGYWICHPGREPSPESRAILQRWLTNADPVEPQIGLNSLTTRIVAPAEFGDPGYRGLLVHRWRQYQPTTADRLLAQIMVERVLDGVRQERLVRQLHQHRLQVENLQFALAHSREIGAAIGILMATRQVDAEGAFDLLRSASQYRQRKLRDIAAEVVFTGLLGASESLLAAGRSSSPDQRRPRQVRR